MLPLVLSSRCVPRECEWLRNENQIEPTQHSHLSLLLSHCFNQVHSTLIYCPISMPISAVTFRQFKAVFSFQLNTLSLQFCRIMIPIYFEVVRYVF